MVANESETATHAPRLSDKDEERAEENAAVPAPVLHETIRHEGEQEMGRPNSSLLWSGLAAGLSMGFSLIAEGVISAALPETPWATLVSKLGYPFGFLIVILGRQQLFTENTLTAVLPVMARRDLHTLGQMLRLWTVVLIANLIGALLIALVLHYTGVFPESIKETFARIGRHAAEPAAGTLFLRAIFAGWLIAILVWMLPGAGESKVGLIILITWLVGAAEFSHVIAGAAEVFYITIGGDISWGRCLGGYLVPVLLGNTVGGVTLVAGVNHAQVVAGRHEERGRKPDETHHRRATRI